MGQEGLSGESRRTDGDGGDQVEPQESQIRQVVPAQGFLFEVGVNQAESAKTGRGCPVPGEVGQ